MDSNQIIDSLKLQVAELKKKVETKDNEIFDILKFFELAIVDTRDDMRIVNSSGAVEEIFRDAEKLFERGNDLIKIVYKITRNTKPRKENLIEDLIIENQDDAESIISRFVNSSRQEMVLNMIGERSDAEVFLLVWKMKRIDGKYFRSFFKIIPTNSLIKAMQEKHFREISQMKNNLKSVFDLLAEGITILSLNYKIEFMNESAKSIFLYKNPLLQNANLYGKFFQDIFINEEPEDTKEILNIVTRTLTATTSQAFVKKVFDKETINSIYLLKDEKYAANAFLIITRYATKEQAGLVVDNTKLLTALKNLSIENQKIFSKFKEFENSIKLSSLRIKEQQNSIILLYTFLESIPIPIAIVKLPSRRYEFVNVAFEKRLVIRRDFVKGKLDEDLFTIATCEVINQRIDENINEPQKITEFYLEGILVRQLVLCNTTGDPIYILRTYFDNN